MGQLTAVNIALFILTCLGNLAGASLLPATKGLTNPGFTFGVVACYVVGIWALARLFVNGAPLSLMIPLMSVVIPMMSVAVGVLIYHESASWPRIGLLVAACGLVTLASRV